MVFGAIKGVDMKLNWPNRVWVKNHINGLWYSRHPTDEDIENRKDCEFKLHLARQRRLERGHYGAAL